MYQITEAYWTGMGWESIPELEYQTEDIEKVANIMSNDALDYYVQGFPLFWTEDGWICFVGNKDIIRFSVDWKEKTIHTLPTFEDED